MRNVLSSCSLDSFGGEAPKVDEFVCNREYNMPLKRTYISVPTAEHDDLISMLSNPVELSDVCSQISGLQTTMDESSVGIDFITNDDLVLENFKNKYIRRNF
jgi:hypothetical protein